MDERPTFPFPPRIDGEALGRSLTLGLAGLERALGESGHAAGRAVVALAQTATARREAVEERRAAERTAEAKEQHYQNEHHPERDEARGITRCRRCERLLAMDARPEFRQLHPCSVLRG